MSMEEEPGRPENRIPYGLILILALAIVLVIGTGLYYYVSQEQQLTDAARDDLTVIAQLKTEQIAQWRQDRLNDAQEITANPFFTEAIARFLQAPDPATEEKIRAQLTEIVISNEFENALLVDQDGTVRFSLDPSVTSVSPAISRDLAAAYDRKEPVLTDLYRTQPGNRIRMDAIAPLVDRKNGTETVAGAVILAIDPDTYLYPLVRKWPVPSVTAETLIVGRRNDTVIFLNDLKYRNNTALNLTIPLSRTEVPAVMAALGTTGTYEGTDYRNEKVVSAIMPVPGSPWFMVAKVDTAEAYATWRTRAGFILVLVTGALVSVAVITGLVWQRRQKYYYKNLYHAAHSLRESEARFSTVFQQSPIGTSIIRISDGTLVDANRAFFDTFGYSREEMIGHAPGDLEIWSDPHDVDTAIQVLQKAGRIRNFEIRFRKKTGEPGDALVSAETIEIAGENYMLGLVQDITEHKRAESLIKQKTADLEEAYEEITATEEELRQNYEVLAASQKNLRESEEKYRTLMENTGTAMVIIENDTTLSLANRQFTILSGFTKEEIEGKKSWTEFVVGDDLEKMLAQHRLRREDYDRALREYEFRFLRRNGDVRIVQLIIDLLPGTKKSVASLIDITERKRAEQAFAEEATRRRILLDQSQDGVVTLDGTGKVAEANRRFAEMLGYTTEEIRALHVWDWDARFDRETLSGMLRTVDERGDHFETRHRRKDGSVFDVEISTNAATFSGEKMIFCVVRDITGRKLAEEQLKRFNEDLEQKVADRTKELTESLAERELLLREIHHRVKNNLQIVASLFNLQSRYISDEKVLEAVRESQNRVRAMALVHERIYREEKLSSINLGDYLHYLGSQLFRFYAIKPSQVSFELDCPDIQLDIDSAIPLGLIVNELVSNALKHAFPDGRKGKVSIRCRCETTDPGVIELLIADDGIGMPEGFDWKNAPSLGLRLVVSLIAQLNGSIEMDTTVPGTQYRITAQRRRGGKP